MIFGSLLRPERQGILGIIPALAGALVLAVTVTTTQLSTIARGVAIGCLVASVVAALAITRRDVRTHLSITLAIVAVALTGVTRTGAPYIVASVGFAFVVVACFRAPLVGARLYGPDASPRAAKERPALRLRATALLVAVGGAVTAFFVSVLPPASAYAERQVQRYAGNVVADNDDAVGFNTNIRIGSLNHVLRSDRVIMRIDGDRVEYLRGVVLDDYSARVWSSSRAKNVTPFVADAPSSQATLHIELSRAALAGRAQEPRWFLPEDACNVGTPSGRLTVDPYGAAHPDPPNDAREIWFRRAPRATCEKPLGDAAAPTRQDLQVAQKIRDELKPIAIGWTLGTSNAREALDAIVRHLAAFEYSLEDRREGHNDPVFEFLTLTHRGHCELFASALALLARTVAIPTRLVAGYHVDEVNPITGLATVRDRNAHTWVEAWVGDRWISLDPTPVSDAGSLRRTSNWEDFSEALSLAWDRTIGFIASISLASFGIFSGVTAIALIILRRFLRRRSERRRSGLRAASRPLPAFEALAAALARAGFVRTESEPLERFARRLDDAGEPWSSDVADALARYADLRYGGIGEERTIATRLEALAQKIVPTA